MNRIIFLVRSVSRKLDQKKFELGSAFLFCIGQFSFLKRERKMRKEETLVVLESFCHFSWILFQPSNNLSDSSRRSNQIVRMIRRNFVTFLGSFRKNSTWIQAFSFNQLSKMKIHKEICLISQKNESKHPKENWTKKDLSEYSRDIKLLMTCFHNTRQNDHLNVKKSFSRFFSAIDIQKSSFESRRCMKSFWISIPMQ